MPSSEVMGKWKSGQLHSGGPGGPAVHNQKQAVAIMLSEKRKEAANGGVYPEKKAAGGPIVNKGHRSMEASFAKGGAVQDPAAKDFKKEDPQGRGRLGTFLGTENRFSGGALDKRVVGAPMSQETEEVWPKGKGVGRTEHDDQGDDKSLPPVKPRK